MCERTHAHTNMETSFLETFHMVLSPHIVVLPRSNYTMNFTRYLIYLAQLQCIKVFFFKKNFLLDGVWKSYNMAQESHHKDNRHFKHREELEKILQD